MVHRVASQPSRMEGGGRERDQRDWTWRVRTKRVWKGSGHPPPAKHDQQTTPRRAHRTAEADGDISCAIKFMVQSLCNLAKKSFKKF